MAAAAQHVMVFGTGSIGRRHADNLTHLGAQVTQLSWRETGLDGALSALDRECPDAAVIATATDVRLDLIAACAARNIALYIEKPLAFRAADVAAIFDAAAPIATRSLVGFMMRYHPIVAALRDLGLEDAYRFDFEIGHDVTQWRQNWKFADSYAARPEGGGVLLDLCHELDMAHTLLPDLSLAGVTSLGHADFPGVDMESQCALTSSAGHGTVSMDYLAPASTRRARLRSLNACAEADFGASTLTVDRGDGPAPQHFDFDRNEMFLAAMSDFLALAAGQTPSSGLPHAPRMDATRPICDLIAQAWESRRFIGTVNKDLT